jgi:hypothetical protein
MCMCLYRGWLQTREGIYVATSQRLIIMQSHKKHSIQDFNGWESYKPRQVVMTPDRTVRRRRQDLIRLRWQWVDIYSLSGRYFSMYYHVRVNLRLTLLIFPLISDAKWGYCVWPLLLYP